jgi:membrane protein involved in colicin uptake
MSSAAQRKQEVEAARAARERRMAEELAKEEVELAVIAELERREEEERKRKEEEARREAEAEKKRKEEEETRRKAEEARKAAEDAMAVVDDGVESPDKVTEWKKRLAQLAADGPPEMHAESSGAAKPKSSAGAVGKVRATACWQCTKQGKTCVNG